MRTRVARRAPIMAALVISSFGLTVFAPVVGAANGLEVTTQYPAIVVAPGNKVSFELRVTSTRPADVALSLVQGSERTCCLQGSTSRTCDV